MIGISLYDIISYDNYCRVSIIFLYIIFASSSIYKVVLEIDTTILMFLLFVFYSFDGGNDEWISTISQAFEGFSDFKKIDGGQETDLK